MNIRAMYSQPSRLTPAELQADALLSLENRERYRLQSENTSVNALASLPARRQARGRAKRVPAVSWAPDTSFSRSRLVQDGRQVVSRAV